nr:MAG TPA: hypothetical protein [Caudoviricetes sp.]
MTEQHEKIANELENALNKLQETINKIVTEMLTSKSKTEKEKVWEMKYPYKNNDACFILFDDGDTGISYWAGDLEDVSRFGIGNVFPTLEAAELEAKRRSLLTRFNAFRDECNDGWKPDWNNHNSKKWTIGKNEEGMYAMWTVGLNSFSYFGCFKNQFDTERAIELFGDEIQKLFIDCECD